MFFLACFYLVARVFWVVARWLFIVCSEKRLCDLLVCRYNSGFAFHVDFFFCLFYGPADENGVPDHLE